MSRRETGEGRRLPTFRQNLPVARVWVAEPLTGGLASTSRQGPDTGGRPPRWVRSDVGMGFTDRLEPAPHYPQPVGPGAHFSQRLLQSWFLTRTPSHHLVFNESMTFDQFFLCC